MDVPIPEEAWLSTLPSDPRPWLLASGEPAARWVTLTGLLDLPADHPDVGAAHADVLADPLTEDLLGRLTPWDVEAPLSGHNAPQFAPNLIGLLADMGVTAADDRRVADVLESMLAHQAEDGRFLALATTRSGESALWGALPCDAFAIAETLARAGYAGDARVVRALDRIAGDLGPTAQGLAWRCIPDPQIRFRGPGRVGDACVQVTLEALRAFSYLPLAARPPALSDAAATVLGVWRNRGEHKPYMFGHGRQFKRGKWPATWYSALEVVDTLGRYPELWADPASPERGSLAEVAACLIAYTLDSEGRVVPHSTFRGFEGHSFGQKRLPSAFATARTLVALRRLAPLAHDIAAVDVMALPSSMGGTGTPLAP